MKSSSHSSTVALLVSLVVTPLFAMSGCKSKTQDAPSPAASASAQLNSMQVGSAAPQSTLGAAPPSATVDAFRNASINDRFAGEAAARPTGTPKAEDVYAKFTSSGIALTHVKQHLASPLYARYCVGAKIEGKIAMSVCEYNDEAAAKAGTDMSMKALSNIPNRTVTTNKKTTLILREEAKTPENDALVAQMQGIFAKL